jgi:hypothetical protein
MNGKNLEFIQGIITRLAGNSFQMKGWNVGLATAVIGFVAAKEGNPGPAAAYAMVPGLAFWLLDGYYLALETRFRELYQSRVTNNSDELSLKPDPLDARLMVKSFFRPAVLFVHAPMVSVIYWVTR